MKISSILFRVSACLIFLAWIAKMHFVFGGDYLLRAGTGLALGSFLLQLVIAVRNRAGDFLQIRSLFLLNTVCLMIVYAGMMLKVSHLMNTQLEKDILLDFVGIPAILLAVLYNFSRLKDFTVAAQSALLLFAGHVLLPWTIFLFSFLFYCLYSAILAFQ